MTPVYLTVAKIYEDQVQASSLNDPVFSWPMFTSKLPAQEPQSWSPHTQHYRTFQVPTNILCCARLSITLRVRDVLGPACAVGTLYWRRNTSDLCISCLDSAWQNVTCTHTQAVLKTSVTQERNSRLLLKR